MPVILRLSLVIVFFGLIAGGVYVIKQRQGEALAQRMAGGPPPATVTATSVALLPWAQRIEAVGDLKAIQDVAIASEVPGKVVGIRFESGAAVGSGDVLVELDAGDDRAQLASLKAELELAQQEHRRVRRLQGSAAFSQSQLDRTQSQMASLQAQVERASVLLDRKVVRAPFAGVLGIREVSLGTFVSAGQPIVQLQSLSPIYVDFTVPERHRAALEVGQRIELEVAAWPGSAFAGALSVVSVAVDVRTRTLRLRGELPNTDGRLQPGMFATVHLVLSDDQPVLTLPRTAISFFAYGESVFTITEQDGGELTVQRQPITVGRTRGERVEVLSGLKDGQRVVHTGHLKLRDGQTVVVDAGIPLPHDVTDG